MLPDFNRLKIFYYVYQAGSVVGAARQLNLTQPAVSQQLQKLEAEMKVQLFTRLHKRLVPTASGQRLFRLTEPLITRLQEELPYIREPHERPSGILRIGAPREFGKEYLPRFCHAFRKHYPAVQFRLKFKESVPLLTMLQQGDLDFALVDVYYNKGELAGFPDIFSIDPLLKEVMILACSRDYYAAYIGEDHSYEQLCRHEFITDEDDPSILDLWFKHHFKKIPENLDVVMTLDSHEALISGIRLGMGLGVATAHLMWEELQSGVVVPVRTTVADMVNMISLVQLQDKVPTLTEKTFRDFMLENMLAPDVLKRFRLPATLKS